MSIQSISKVMKSAIAMFLIAMTTSVRADVVYDTLYITTDSLANNTNQPATIGIWSSPTNPDELVDLNVADDFELSEAYKITGVTQAFRRIAFPDGDPPFDGVLVEFFENTKINRPDAQPVAAFFAPDFTAEPFMYSGDIPGWYFSVDLSSADIEFDPGTWWVSITPVDEVPETGGDWRVFRQTGVATLIGNPSNRRSGGIAHGNGYPTCCGYSSYEWAPHSAFQGTNGNVAMRIEGTPIGKPDCPADIVSSATFQPPPDGVVDGADLAFLLGEWGRNKGSLADIVSSDTFQPPPDGVVDGADLAYLLGAWGGCE